MHPDLWTVPGIEFSIRSYGFLVGVGIIVGLWISIERAKRVKCDPATITSMSVIGLLLGIVGAKGMHQLHYFGDAVTAGEVGVKGALAGGGEILGGIVLAVLGVVGYLLIRRKPVRLYLDIMFPQVILAMGIGRVGCLMFGCCWGGVCVTEAGDKNLPWAIHFPYGSPAYERQLADNRIHVPDELLWKIPGTDRREPIPREVLSQYDIDNDAELHLWADTNAAYLAVRVTDPDDDETQRLKAKLDTLKAKLGTRAKRKLLEQLAAVTHLQDLSHREGSRVTTWAGLQELAAAQHSLWVHPTQVYDAVALTLMFFLLSAIFRRRRRYGMVVAWTMILYPINRFIQEMLRVDNPHDVWGLTVSQFISVAVFAIGVLFAVMLARTAPAPAINDE